MNRLFSTLVACAALSVGCEATRIEQERLEPGQSAPKPSTDIRNPQELSQGIWSITIDIDVSTADQQFIRAGNSQNVTSKFLANYQGTFTLELQRALKRVLDRNAHCTISALTIVNARQGWVDNGGNQGGPMSLPSGAIVVLPCGGNEPLVKPEAPAPPMPH